MIYSSIRIVLSGIVFLLCLLCLKKHGDTDKRVFILKAVLIAFIFQFLVSLVPFENIFVTFSSAESAFRYANTEQVEFVVEGIKTDLVVARKEENAALLVAVPKTDKGWKLGIGSGLKLTEQKRQNGITVGIYRYKNSNEYYISIEDILDTDGDPLQISDNRNTNFSYFTNEVATLNTTFYTYYACVQNINDKYELTVNGTKFCWGENVGAES